MRRVHPGCDQGDCSRTLGIEAVMSIKKRVTRCIKSAGDILLAGIAPPDDHNVTPLVTEFNGRHAERERASREGVGRCK